MIGRGGATEHKHELPTTAGTVRGACCASSRQNPRPIEQLLISSRCHIAWSPAAPAMAASGATKPGVQFFNERLQRAQAVPAAERTREVAAFIESAHLLERLPAAAREGRRQLGAARRPAGPGAPAGGLLIARAHYVCPSPPSASTPTCRMS